MLHFNKIYIEETNSSLQKIALSDRTSDGFNPHLSVQDEVAAKRCASMVDNVYRALAEGKTDKDGILMGRTSGNIIVEFEGDEKLIGQFVNVKITKSRNWILNGVLFEN